MNRSRSRTAIDPAETSRYRERILDKLTYSLGKSAASASDQDWFCATALAVRDHVVERWEGGVGTIGKRVNYLSVEFLIGRLLFDAISNLKQIGAVQDALAELGVDFNRLRQLEPDAALGSGGLGRLAACFMDSLATLGIPAVGYGIRYRLGLFRQYLRDGWQQEFPDDWLALGNPWEFERPDITYPIRFGGTVEYRDGGSDTARGHWDAAEELLAQAYDVPIVGAGARHVNTLRLWSARGTDTIRLTAHDSTSYAGAIESRRKAEEICRSLYPDDSTAEGQELRLRQEYFFTSASIQDIVARHMRLRHRIDTLTETATIQLNDTHPAIAVAELMRLLVDEHQCSWTDAWSITQRVMNYTNHTLLPEALESWPAATLNRLLPRHMQIIYLINHYHLHDAVARGHTDLETIAAISLIAEGDEQRVRMGHLAFLGAARVNGVSALHSELMRKTTFAALDRVLPGKIINETNGISPRRWLLQANPTLATLIGETIGPAFRNDLAQLAALEPFAGDASLVGRFAETRLRNKVALSQLIRDTTGIKTDPTALFDIHIKRIHEYKRQLLNVLEALALYHAIKQDPNGRWVPRVKIFAGKAASSYARAKLIIKLIHDAGRLINADPDINGLLKIVFLPNYSVSLAEALVPAADLSEQISTAGMEASGTGNMKLALNGALTIGTLDGANVEIRERVGADNFFLFGLDAGEVEARLNAGFPGADAVAASPTLQLAVDCLGSGLLSPEDPDRYRPLIDAILGSDRFMVAADFDAYWQTQRMVDLAFTDTPTWFRKSLLNVARSGWFSSDRTIRDYARDIWTVDA